jgi:hypothetical protein
MVFMAITQLDLYELFPERAVARGNELVRAKHPLTKILPGLHILSLLQRN